MIIGPPRHLALLPGGEAVRLDWPVPFADGLDVLDGLRGKCVVALVSGDPFWFGAGKAIAARFQSGEWRALPGVSSFSLAAARLGWALETVPCLGLHARPLARLRPHLVPGQRAIVTLREGASAGELAAWLDGLGFGATVLHVLEALGGPRERLRLTTAAGFDLGDVAHPVLVALEFAGTGQTVSVASGQADDLFDHDGQITKRPVRAMTLSALAPRAGERLWDIGAGSGSVALEWLLSHPTNRAHAIETRIDRAEVIRANAAKLGLDRLDVVTGAAPEALTGLPAPDAIFVGGGLNAGLLGWLEAHVSAGTRLVANAVTLDTEAVLVAAQARRGGQLLKLEMSEASPLGRFRGWKAAYPIVQWSVTL